MLFLASDTYFTYLMKSSTSREYMQRNKRKSFFHILWNNEKINRLQLRVTHFQSWNWEVFCHLGNRRALEVAAYLGELCYGQVRQAKSELIEMDLTVVFSSTVIINNY